jgi:hypothetical protein
MLLRNAGINTSKFSFIFVIYNVNNEVSKHLLALAFLQMYETWKKWIFKVASLSPRTSVVNYFKKCFGHQKILNYCYGKQRCNISAFIETSHLNSKHCSAAPSGSVWKKIYLVCAAVLKPKFAFPWKMISTVLVHSITSDVTITFMWKI